MTRQKAKENLIALGIAEPTDEQITSYLNTVNGETQRERDRANQYKENSEKADELQRQLDEINSQGLSDLEKANKRIAELEKQATINTRKQKLAEKGITGEDADKLFGEDGEFDFDRLGKIIEARETQAASNKEKELLDKTPNPDGKGGGKDDGKELTSAEKIAKSLFGDKKQSGDSVLSRYL